MKKKVLVVTVVLSAVALLTAVAWALTVSSRTETIGGSNVGSVIVNNETPFRIRFAAGGLSPGERAALVARRLGSLQGLRASEVRTGVVNGQHVVLARDQLIITADSNHAAANNSSPQQLAVLWRNNLRASLSATDTTPPPIGGGPGTPLPVETARKVVPILSAGEGIRVGLALVTGPSERVKEVEAVAQIEGDFRGNARVRGLVPIDAESIINFRRVPQTSVFAIGDIRL